MEGRPQLREQAVGRGLRELVGGLALLRAPGLGASHFFDGLRCPCLCGTAEASRSHGPWRRLLHWWGVHRPSAAQSHGNLLTLLLSGPSVDLQSPKSWGWNPGTACSPSSLGDAWEHRSRRTSSIREISGSSVPSFLEESQTFRQHAPAHWDSSLLGPGLSQFLSHPDSVSVTLPAAHAIALFTCTEETPKV